MPRKPAPKSSQKATKTTEKSTVPVGALVPQPHGGALRNGGTNSGGPGRPPDEVRARLRAIGFEKGVPFLDKLMDGEILFQVVCSRCGQTDVKSYKALEEKLREEIRASVDQRLKAMEQLFKYGLGTKDEVSLTDHPQWQRRMAALRSALVEIVGEEAATQVILRADALARQS